MKQATRIMLAAASLGFGCWIAAAPALARPPTATTSPGYDRRLVESRKQLLAPAPLQWHDEKPVRRWKHKRRH